MTKKIPGPFVILTLKDQTVFHFLQLTAPSSGKVFLVNSGENFRQVELPCLEVQLLNGKTIQKTHQRVTYEYSVLRNAPKHDKVQRSQSHTNVEM